MSVPVALPAALAYGVADFAGGLATRRAPVVAVTAGAQLAGLLALAPVAAVVHGTGLVAGAPSAAGLVLGGLAGIAGSAGLLLYLRALAVGPMGVVAPLSAVVGAGLPLGAGVLGGERPGLVTAVALVVALAAIVLASTGPGGAVAGRGVALGLASGVGFGLFFVTLDATPAGSGLWPLLAGRMVSVTLLAVLLVAAGVATSALREPSTARLVVFSGVFDTAANVLFLAATRLGDLGISAVVVSLYPVVVVVLARVVLGERLSRSQLTSAGLALSAGVLFAAGG